MVKEKWELGPQGGLGTVGGAGLGIPARGQDVGENAIKMHHFHQMFDFGPTPQFSSQSAKAAPKYVG